MSSFLWCRVPIILSFFMLLMKKEEECNKITRKRRKKKRIKMKGWGEGRRGKEKNQKEKKIPFLNVWLLTLPCPILGWKSHAWPTSRNDFQNWQIGTGCPCSWYTEASYVRISSKFLDSVMWAWPCSSPKVREETYIFIDTGIFSCSRCPHSIMLLCCPREKYENNFQKKRGRF